MISTESNGKPLVLVVEDEKRVSSFLEQSLREAAYEVIVSSDGETAETVWHQRKPDLVILDLMLNGVDGADILKRVRERGVSTPVLVLSAKSSMWDRVSGLDAGADDYLGKPFGIEELLARIRVLLRRAKDPSRGPVTIGDLTIDMMSRRVVRAGRVVFLSETEYRLLEMLATHLDETISKREILIHVWDDAGRDDNVVEVYISYLRNKLESKNSRRLIHTVRGQGYRLSEHHDVP